MTREAGPAVVSGVLAVLLYAVTLGGTYAYDDRRIVVEDHRVRHVADWGQLWTRDYFDGGLDNLYRPLVSSSYAVEWWLHGDRPWVFHGVNVALHAAAAAAVAEVARRAAGRAAAYGAGVLFAAHPVHVEAVANLVGRAELACTLAVVSSVAILLRRPLTAKRAAGVIGCGMVAVLCKEQGLVAPLLWAVVVWLLWRYRPAGRERATVRGAALAVVWVWAGYVLARQHWLRFDWDRGLLDRAMQPMVLSTAVDRVVLPVSLVGRYAALLAWPARLSPDYGGDVIGPHWAARDPYVWIGAAVVLAWVGGVVTSSAIWRRSRVAAVPKGRSCRGGERRFGTAATLFCLVAVAVSYALVANAVSLIGTIFNERLIYLPSAFVAVLAGMGVARLPRRVGVVVLVGVVVAMGVRTVRSAAEWNDPRALFARALADHPGSIQLHLALAEADREAGREADRRAVLADACARFPDYWRCWGDAARAAADAGDFAAAEDDLRYAMGHAFNPGLAAARDHVRERAAATRP